MKEYKVWTKLVTTEYRMGYVKANSKKEIRERFRDEFEYRHEMDLTEDSSDVADCSEYIHTIEEVKEEGHE
tara:strand:- start:263 stop:475 length:213 start_codon:yes stop_codon:yes gene_type:complete